MLWLEVSPVKEGQGRVFQPGTTGRKRSWGGNELGTSVDKSGMRCGKIGAGEVLLGLEEPG